MGPRPGGGGTAAALVDRLLELPTVLGAREAMDDAMEETEEGPRFPANALDIDLIVCGSTYRRHRFLHGN